MRSRSGTASSSMALFAVCVGAFMATLDSSIVNVALPRIETDLGTATSGLEWVVNGYVLAFAALLLTAGALGDRLGQRRVFLTGVAVFGAASPVCSLASSIGVLVAARMVQGAGAALLVPASLSLVTQSFPRRQEQATAVGIWSLANVLGSLFGPVVGGLLVDSLGWGSVFWINVPIAFGCISLSLRYVANPPGARERSFDIPGQLAAVVGLSALTIAVIEGPLWGWASAKLLATGAIAFVLLVSFLGIERRQPDPMLPLGLFEHPGVAAANTVGILITANGYGILFVLSLWFQQERGYAPSLAGLGLLPMSMVAAFSCIFAGRLTARVGPRIPMVIGTGLAAVSALALSTMGVGTPYVMVGLALVVLGWGVPFSTVPVSTTAVGSVGPDQAGIASGTVNTSRQLGGLLGVALMGGLYGHHHSLAVPMAAGTAILVLANLLCWTWIPNRIAHRDVALATAVIEPGLP